MSVIERIEKITNTAQSLGYRIRYDYFGGTGGGICAFSGVKWIFIDLALTSAEQLAHLENLLHDEPGFQIDAERPRSSDKKRAA